MYKTFVLRGQRYIRGKLLTIIMLLAEIVMLAVILVPKQPEPIIVNPEVYTPLLNTIAKGESSGNYNAYYGNSSNQTVNFTNMTIAEVLKWQEDQVRQGSPSSAAGRYQIVRPTLVKLVHQLCINPQAHYDQAMQGHLAIALMERRGSLAYVEKKLTLEQFAANLAKEWAALPRFIGDNPQASYYAGDGLNQSRISIEEVKVVLSFLKSNAIVR